MNKVIFILLLSVLTSPVAAQDMPAEVRADMQKKYDQWTQDCQTLPKNSQDPKTFTSLDSFKAIIKTGEAAMPFIQDRMINWNLGSDYLLAYAVIEIRGWDVRDFEVAGNPADSVLGANMFSKNIASYLMDEWMTSPQETLKNRQGTDWPYPGKTAEEDSNK